MGRSYRAVGVWSLLQRVIHWSIAIPVLFLIPIGIFIYTADMMDVPEKWIDAVTDIHASIGLVLIAAVVARFIYLFAGPPLSRWSDVIPHTKKQLAAALDTARYYLRGFKGRPPLYLGHNPFAGIAYAVFFIFASTQAFSGLTMFIYRGREGTEDAADMAVHASSGAMEHAHAGHSEWVHNLHDLGAAVIIAFVLAHLIALAVHEVAEKRGLISSMVSGVKFFDAEEIKELEGEIKDKRGRI